MTMSQHDLRILFDTPNSELHGGLPTHLPILEVELRRHVDLELFMYGRRTDTETIFDKFFDRSKDLIDLRSKILRFKPSIIHHNTAFDAIAFLRDAPLLLLCKSYRVPVLLKMHGGATEAFGKLNPLFTAMRNIVLRYANCITVLSEVERKQFLNKWPFLGSRLKVAKNIIHPDFYAIRRQEAVFPTLLFISRFIREKGPFEVLDALPRVIHKFPSAQFIFIGSGRDASEFDERVRDQKLDFCVKRLNHVDNLATAPFYASAWALIFPTHLPEGMPMVVAQALAAGVPVITTRTQFSQSYMVAGRHCLFVEDTNPASIERSIVYLFERKELREKIGKNNHQLAKSFDREVVTNEFLQLYNNILNSDLATQMNRRRDRSPAVSYQDE
jgi:glycosyltransferase involved in cell wall biosynthesis